MSGAEERSLLVTVRVRVKVSWAPELFEEMQGQVEEGEVWEVQGWSCGSEPVWMLTGPL